MASARPAPPPPPPPAQVDAEAAEPWEVPKPRPRVARAAIIGLLASLAAAGALGYYGTHRHHEPEKAPNVGPLLPPSGSTAGGVKRPLAMAPPASHAQPAPPAEAPVVPASPLAPPIQPPGQSSSSANGGNLGQRLNDTMTRAVRRYYSQIAACRSHSTLPTGLALSVDVTMALGPNGQVTSAHSTSADPAASCVLDVVRHMQLDWSGPTPTQITYTFQLP